MTLNQTEILNNAKAIAQQYLDNFNCTGDYDLEAIRQALQGRTHEGKPVKVVVVASPAEAKALLDSMRLNSSVQPHNCIWDYYLMSFYHSTYKQCPDQSHEFGRQDFFEAFKAGLGFYINLGNFAIGIARPETHLDPQRRIHRENGPAIVWGNAKQYWWHGVQVEKDWIENKESVDPSLGLTWQNIEQRRALCEILGWEKILTQLKCETIHKDEFGELIQVSLPGSSQPDRFVRVTCATGRTFCLPTALTCKTAREAVALSYNVPEKFYEPEVRT